MSESNGTTTLDLSGASTTFTRTGMSGGLNRYRNVDRDWEDMAAFGSAAITQPSLFVGGAVDGPTVWSAGSIAKFGETMPNLHKSVTLDGIGHWVKHEAPDELNAEPLAFLATL